VTESNMSFGASFKGGKLEYALHGVDSLFAQRRNLVSPKYIKMIRDIQKFNAGAWVKAEDPDISIGDFISKMGLGDWFRDYYLLPFTGAIWSTPKSQMMDFPAQAMLQFMENHALLDFSGQHQWYTVQGGSIEYVKRLEAKIASQGSDIRLGAPVQSVSRSDDHVDVTPFGGVVETFDEVVFACHSDQALALLADPSEHEARSLGAVRYQANEAVLHADTAMMPKLKKCWASWVYCEDAAKTSDKIDLTYWMNSLQPIPKNDPMFVTLNSTRTIREELIYDTATFHHPVFDAGALKAQASIAKTNGANRTWFCGAWMKNGFHEDGFSSAYDVAMSMDASSNLVAAE
jgi:predicted NAD/FAD-binding protein